MKRISTALAALIMCLLIFSSCTPGAEKESRGDTEDTGTIQTEGQTEAKTEPSGDDTEKDTVEYDENGTYIYLVNDNYYTVSTGVPQSNGLATVKTAEPYLYYKPCDSGAEIMNYRGRYVLLHDGADHVLLDTYAHSEKKVNLPSDCLAAYIVTETSDGSVAGFRINTELALKYVPMDADGAGTDGYDDISVDSYGGKIFAYSTDEDYIIERTYVLSASDGKLEKTLDGYYTGLCLGGGMYYKRFLNGFGGDIHGDAEMYDSELVKITDDTARKMTVDPDGDLIYVPALSNTEEAGHYLVYSPSGELLFQSPEYKSIMLLWQNYALVVTNDSRLVLIDKDGGVKQEFCDWSDDLMFHYLLSGYHEKPFDSGYPAGLYFIVENLKIPFGTVGSGIEYYYVPQTGESGKILTEGVGGYAKPVLYLYPEREFDVSVRFAHPEMIEVSYPEYGEGWEMRALPDGTLISETGRTYYALYWEENAYVPCEFKYGFCVNAEEAADFLEEKLAEIGLTEREANEFIMYWLPLLERNGMSLVSFEFTQSRESFNGLDIYPVPDSLLRFAIHIKKVEKETYIVEQQLPHFERRGFAAVEWGGFAYGN